MEVLNFSVFIYYSICTMVGLALRYVHLHDVDREKGGIRKGTGVGSVYHNEK